MVACSPKREDKPLSHSSEKVMRATLTVTGGFTGAAGKWEVDAASADQKMAVAPDKWQEFERLVNQAQAEHVFGQDYTKTASVVSPTSVPADMQTYELLIDGRSVRWTEPIGTGSAAAPDVVKALKSWITRNTKREPFRPK